MHSQLGTNLKEVFTQLIVTPIFARPSQIMMNSARFSISKETYVTQQTHRCRGCSGEREERERECVCQ
jgi:hypothetical protein